jgi:hypothetical protein
VCNSTLLFKSSKEAIFTNIHVFCSHKNQALGRLHQLEVLGQRLVVELAKSQHKHLAGQERTRYII